MLQKLLTLLFVSGDPITVSKLAELSGSDLLEVSNMLPKIKEYLNQGGLDLLVNKNEVSIVTKAEYADLTESFWREELTGELTQSALQVLTLVAYLESPTKQDISFIRGVQSSQSIRSLTVRGLIRKEGEECTLTSDALKYLGITKKEELPEYETLSKELSEKLELVKKN